MIFFNKAVLRLLLLPKKVYVAQGVDFRQLQAILQIKLEIDDRTPSSILKTRKKKNKEHNSVSLLTLLSSCIMGCVFLFSFAVSTVPVTQYTVFFSMFIVFLSFSLISDFSGVLLDTKDNYIILPKPVNATTFALARILHILVHVIVVSLPMELPAVVFIICQKGIIVALGLFLAMNLALLFVVFLVNAIYLFFLKIMSPQRFKSIMVGIQIAIAILVYASYTIMPKWAAKQTERHLDISNLRGILCVPSYWFGSLISLLEVRHGSWMVWSGMCLAIVVPVISLWMVVTYLAPSFNNRIAQLSNSADATSVVIVPTSGVVKVKKTWGEKFAQFFTKNNLSRAGFMLTWQLTGRLKEFKMRVYPFLGYVIVYTFMLSMQGERSMTLADIREQSGSGKMLFVGIIYSAALFIWTALSQSAFSERFKASWIYYTMPITQPGRVIAGAYLSIIVKLFFPIFFLVSLAAICIVGWEIIPNLLLGAFNLLLLVLLMAYLDKKRMPFSAWQGNESKAGSVARSLLKMLLIGLFGVGHYFIYNNYPLVILCSLLSLIAMCYVYVSIRDISWDKIIHAEQE